mgnify:FL=1
MKKIQKIRGAHEINPSESQTWSYLTKKITEIFESFSYQEIRLPIIESTSLFQRSVGEGTDIVNKEMFTFESKSGKSLSLRPEGTAGCLRASIEMGLTDQGPIRLFYHGPMYRYERPQKGRNREFYQLSAEAYGFDGVNIDSEMIYMSHKIFSFLNLKDYYLEINSLGSKETQKNFSKAVKDYLIPIKDQLDPDSQARLDSNTLRILDSKNPETQKILKNGPKIFEFLSQKSIEDFDLLRSNLDEMKIPYKVNYNLVRGLDYYNDVVYEWKSKALGSQNTFCAGGRYDSLSKNLGGRDIPAAGFSIGLDRLIISLSDQDTSKAKKRLIVIILEDNLLHAGLEIAETIRNNFEEVVVRFDGVKSNLKSQLKKAIKENYDFAIIIGNEEINKGVYSFKNLKKDDNQLSLTKSEVIKSISGVIENE